MKQLLFPLKNRQAYLQLRFEILLMKNQMICLKVDIPKELNDIDDELKAIYHSRDTVCFFIFKTRNERNEFVERTNGMNKTDREKIYQEYL